MGPPIFKARYLLILMCLNLNAEAESLYVPNGCYHSIQALETPLFDLTNPLKSIRDYIRKKATAKALREFDWDYYRITKLILRENIGRKPPPGIFEDNIAWFEVYLEKEVGQIFDFEQMLIELPQKNKEKLVEFFKKNPFSGPLSQNKIYENVSYFFQLVDHKPITASELFGANATTSRNELLSKTIVTQLTINGLENFFKNIGYNAPETWKSSLKKIFDHPAVVTAKVAAFNSSAFAGVPSVYMPAIKDVVFSSEEINQILLTGDADSLYESRIGTHLKNKLVKNIVLRNIRRRVIEISAVLGMLGLVNEIGQHIETNQIKREVEIEQAKAAARVLEKMIDDTDKELDELIKMLAPLDSADQKKEKTPAHR